MADKNKKAAPKKPKFSPYWIYGGIIIFFIALQIFGSSAGTENKTSPSQFFEFLKEGDVEKVDIVNETTAKIYLRKEAESKEVYDEILSYDKINDTADFNQSTLSDESKDGWSEEIKKINDAILSYEKMNDNVMK